MDKPQSNPVPAAAVDVGSGPLLDQILARNEHWAAKSTIDNELEYCRANRACDPEYFDAKIESLQHTQRALCLV